MESGRDSGRTWAKVRRVNKSLRGLSSAQPTPSEETSSRGSVPFMGVLQHISKIAGSIRGKSISVDGAKKSIFNPRQDLIKPNGKAVSFTVVLNLKKGNSQGQTSLKRRIWTALNKQQLLFVALTMVAGIGTGAYFRSVNAESGSRVMMFVRFPGTIVMNCLNVVIVPFYVTALINGISTFESGNSANIALKNIVYCLSTTLLAAAVGIAAALAIRPGDPHREHANSLFTGDERLKSPDLYLDLIRQIFPPNILLACFTTPKTKLVQQLSSNKSTSHSLIEHEDGTNILGLAMFSIALGIATHKLKDGGEPLRIAVTSFADVSNHLVCYIIRLIPFGILFLVADHVVGMEDPVDTFLRHGYYIFTVLLALVFHGLVVLPIVYLLIVHKNPFTFICGLGSAVMLALATSSSSETLPMTMRSLQGNKIDHRVLSYVIPVGATVNMHGLAIYVTTTCIFCGQLDKMDFNIVHLLKLSMAAVIVSVASAGVPRSGIIALILVLQTVGYSEHNLGIIFAADWILDRFCTVVNVLGDGVGAGVIEKLAQTDIQKMDAEKVVTLDFQDDIIMQRLKAIIKRKEISISQLSEERSLKLRPPTPKKSLFQKSHIFLTELLSSQRINDRSSTDRSSTSV